ncbi:DNA cytosine methyltransferase [Clostridium estertheticum]|uniref:DNA cytosine methyltransferase n=1 Tax=Clostridium estertheticum TaxID=238834 RepID=UPI0021F3E074|nr:DNA (cytosine-5-)-methyltransferase [Clostridium estertheticum]WAG44016.1 DNA (cytosine-5-)-methyltransferase [Clostridium estertheticum]
MKKFKKDVTFIDLFAGIGGFRQALESYGAKCIFSSEKDKFACKSYEANYGDVPSGDITKIKNEEIPKHNILCAGFPCQPFSVSGNQRGFEDSRGTLFFEIARIAEYHKPEILFLENVSNLKKHDDENTLNTMVKVLKDMQYDVYIGLMNASDFNVPQSRKRIYFVCFKNNLNVDTFKFPEPVECTTFLNDILLPDSETSEYIINRPDMQIKDIEITQCQSKPIRIGTINKGGQGDRIYSPVGHAITLSAQGGGAGAKTGAYLVNGKVRKLAPRECALVQGFPKDFKIIVSDNQAYKQFGNSVAVPVLKVIVNKIVELKQLENFTYDCNKK